MLLLLLYPLLNAAGMENMQAIWVIPIDGITMDVVDEAYNTTCVLMKILVI